jgi:tRNA pseudouridine38-40 synthase
MRLKLTLQYQGTPYGGWQYQSSAGSPRLPSIQGEVCAAMNALLVNNLLQPKDIVASGRTDAGVHAWGQVAHVDIPQSYQTRSPLSWKTGLNRHLPLSIRVVAAQEVPLTFHARHSSISRHYTYILWPERVMRPDLIHRAGHAPGWGGAPLNLAAMQSALNTLPLTPTDYSTFRDSECQSRTPICTLVERNLTQHPDGTIWLTIGADHFLHHMVRNLVGTLVEIGQNKRPATNMAQLLAQRDRTAAGKTFAPDGLYFTKVTYPAEFMSEPVSYLTDPN